MQSWQTPLSPISPRFLLFGSLHPRVVPVFLVVDLTLFFYEFNDLGFALARVQKLDADPETWFLDKKTAIHHVAHDRYRSIMETALFFVGVTVSGTISLLTPPDVAQS